MRHDAACVSSLSVQVQACPSTNKRSTSNSNQTDLAGPLKALPVLLQGLSAQLRGQRRVSAPKLPSAFPSPEPISSKRAHARWWEESV